MGCACRKPGEGQCAQTICPYSPELAPPAEQPADSAGAHKAPAWIGPAASGGDGKAGGVFAPTSMKSNMPAYKHQLEPKEIWAVLAYIKSTWPEVILRKHAATNFVGGFQHH